MTLIYNHAMNQHVKIGDRIEVEFGSGTVMMVVNQVVSDDDIRGHDKDGSERFTDLGKIVAKHGNIADQEPDDL